jgi:predicted phosphate transport protein (TIGR00153 family)
MMARSIFGLFARNPFQAMQALGTKVGECAEVVPLLFDAYFEGDHEQVILYSERLSQLEYEADQLKIEARDHLPRSLFMPVDRRDFLDALSSLDAIADCAEDVGILFTLRKMEPHDELIEPLKSLVRRVMTTVRQGISVVDRLDALAMAGFSGPEAADVLRMIDELGRMEHAADIVQDDLARKLFAIEDRIKPGSLLIWNKIFNKVGDMANHAERMGNRTRLFMAS